MAQVGANLPALCKRAEQLAAEGAFYAAIDESHPETEAVGFSPVKESVEEEPGLGKNFVGRSPTATTPINHPRSR